MTTVLDKRAIIEALAGYAVGNDFILAEKQARLSAMTDAEARAIFDELCAAGFAKALPEDPTLAEKRLQAKIEVLKAFEQLARAKGLL